MRGGLPSGSLFVAPLAGAQPRQDPGGTLGMNSFGEREKTCESSLDRAKSAREGERERERMTRGGCLQGLAESGNALFFTMAFIP